MGRRKTLTPKLYFHKSSGHWCVNLDGKRKYLGPDREEAERRYRKELAKHLGGEVAKPKVPGEVRLVLELTTTYATSRKPLVSRSQFEHVKTVCGVLVRLFGGVPVDEFGAGQVRQLKAHLLTLHDARPREGKCVRLLRELLAERSPRDSRELSAAVAAAGHSSSVYRQARKRLGVVAEKRADGEWWSSLPPEKLVAPAPRPLSRRYINSLLGILRTMWRRLASDGLVTAASVVEVESVLNLEAGQGRETAGRLPADDAAIAAALPHLRPALAAMVRLQRLTGMRPGEVCRMRRDEVSTSPTETVHVAVAGHLVPCKAQQSGDVTVWVYAPTLHKGRRRKKPRLVALGPRAQEILRPFIDAATSPSAYLFTPSPRPHHRGVTPSPHYTPPVYAEALERACERAGVARQTPYSLRHAAATDAAQTGDVADLQAQLGHSQGSMTAHYIANLLERAARLAAGNG